VDYISNKDVEVRLLGKVRFTDQDEEENRFPRTLLTRLRREAQGKVERDLSPRYSAPFQGCHGEPFSDLPATTKETLRTMCELMAVIRVLGNDFGRGSVNDASAYKDEQTKLYQEMLTRELEQLQDGSFGQWRYPPLDNLMASLRNTTDDGTAGAILVTSHGEGDFPAKQITDPSENFGNGTIDP
jgi:hypothetical protein